MVIPTADECSSRSAQSSCRKSREKNRGCLHAKTWWGDTKIAINAIHIYFLQCFLFFRGTSGTVPMLWLSFIPPGFYRWLATPVYSFIMDPCPYGAFTSSISVTLKDDALVLLLVGRKGLDNVVQSAATTPLFTWGKPRGVPYPTSSDVASLVTLQSLNPPRKTTTITALECWFPLPINHSKGTINHWFPLIRPY